MSVKKLSIKKNKDKKLKIHNKGDAEKITTVEESSIASSKAKQYPKNVEKCKKNKCKKNKGKDSSPVKKRPINKMGKPVKGTISKTKTNSGAKETEVVFDEVVGEFEALSTEIIATVGFSLSRTVNLGNFESYRVEVSVLIPCGPTKAECTKAYNLAKDWSEAKVSAAMEQYGSGSD